MIDLGDNYKDIQSREDGEFERFPAGGYICIVKDAHTEQSRYTDKLMLVLTLDIAEGKYSKWFETAQYPPKIFKVVFDKDGNISPYFKRLLEHFAQSNIQFSISQKLEERDLIGLKIGVIFREEEYLNGYRETKIAVKPFRTTTTAAIRDSKYTVPPIKKLESGEGAKKDSTLNKDDDDLEEVKIDDSQLPF